MWSRKLKISLVLSVLCSLSLFSPSCFSCYADVTLTDAEAQELENLIQESQKDLCELQMKSEEQLNAVKKDYEEQKKSYEEQLKEAKKDKAEALTISVLTSASMCLISIALIILLF